MHEEITTAVLLLRSVSWWKRLWSDIHRLSTVC